MIQIANCNRKMFGINQNVQKVHSPIIKAINSLACRKGLIHLSYPHSEFGN